ncbi:GTPase Era [Legionella quinlivanii]|uniref:GTPase Era n=1 Tax=Legionella quinlivanii TaxID=45073 RepID=A0A0W0XKX4_9GAMM|nr:Rab family GTPase [Legionella quinlivanii]KTD45224.1 GTPase Era [Legionella quinlivanii]SEG04640.1 small GTP-binding protein domain-containing protein [Legionella quinlivanii DSM 21216]STY11476.1 GTPase Era [Legionella quinlivanii]
MSLYKIAILGKPNTGKTQLVRRLIGSSFQTSYRRTIGHDFFEYSCGKKRAQLCDTVDDPFNESLGSAYLNGVQTILYCVDISLDAPLNIADYQQKIDEITRKHPKSKVILLGTKCDIQNQNALISFTQLADKARLSHLIISSRSDEGIEQLKTFLNEPIVNHVKRTEYREILKKLIFNISKGINRKTCGENSEKVRLLKEVLSDVIDETKHFDEAAIKNRIKDLCEMKRHFWNFYKPHSVTEYEEMIAVKETAPLPGG